jgi:hypothetical protein
MAFNHYAKMKHILEQQPSGWYVKRVDAPTTAKTFNGEIKRYDHYYRIYDKNDNPIKYCKFQQLDRLATVLKVPVQDLPILN